VNRKHFQNDVAFEEKILLLRLQPELSWVRIVFILKQGWATTTIFVRGSHCAFLGALRARFQSKNIKAMIKLKIWSAGRMLTPAGLKNHSLIIEPCKVLFLFFGLQSIQNICKQVMYGFIPGQIICPDCSNAILLRSKNYFDPEKTNFF
jgi:hypothetical protein